MKLEGLATYTPVGVAIAFLAALVYCVGKFAYADGDWVQALTVSDIFATAWKALPLSALGMMSGMLVNPTSIPRVMSDAAIKEAMPQWSLGRALGSLALTISAVAVFFGSLFMAVFASEVIPPERAHLMTFWALAFCGSLVVVMLRFGSSIGLNTGRIIIWGSLVFALSYSSGLTSGGIAAMEPRTDHILLRDGTEVCGSILYAGERGVIYMGPTGRQASLQPWDLVERLSSDWPECESVE